MDKYVDGAALLKVLIASLLGGAGLVAVFAVGLVGTSMAGGPQQTGGRRVAGLSLAAVSFLIVAAGVVLGIYAMLKKPS
jgi:hypothetical protein